MAANAAGTKLFIGRSGADKTLEILRFDVQTWTLEATLDTPCAGQPSDLAALGDGDAFLARTSDGLCVVSVDIPTCMGLQPTIVATSTRGGEIRGTSGPDVILGLSGPDTIFVHGGNDVICAGAGDDSISLNSGSNAIDGGPGKDTVFGGALDTGIHVDLAKGSRHRRRHQLARRHRACQWHQACRHHPRRRAPECAQRSGWR